MDSGQRGTIVFLFSGKAGSATGPPCLFWNPEPGKWELYRYKSGVRTMTEEAVNAIRAWLGTARGSDDGAELALWILCLRAAGRSQKNTGTARGALPLAALS